MSIIAKRGSFKVVTLIILLSYFDQPKLFSFNESISIVAKNIKPGAYQLNQYLPILMNKRVGLVVNHSSMIEDIHLVDTLLKLKIDLKIIFAPEHGFRGNMEAGSHVIDGKDSLTGIKIVSLYGKKFKPNPIDLQGLDVVVFDIQDVGVRFYTFISTLHYVMEACAQNNVPLIILDRPNPNGHYIDGPLLDTNFRSFVGMHPIPVVYGMTIGELAKMIRGECWIKDCKKLDLKVISCRHYTHRSKVKLKIKPSPNLPNEFSILLYPSLCFFEGSVVSLGRGTDFPFQVFGHPKLKGTNGFSFIPEDRMEAQNPPLESKICFGTKLNSGNIDALFQEKKINLNYLISAFKELKMDTAFFLPNLFFDKLAGDNRLRKQILSNESETQIRNSWNKDLVRFKAMRKKYLIYSD
ncbi:MAG: DUF1343 domain-containing protein [Saprospiraceae bacterium]|nr:DUF1343 domain-containing protein [Saprospiraceae bacterium]